MCSGTTDFYELIDRAATALDTVPDGLFALDVDGRIAYVNRHAADIFGSESGQLVGKVLGKVGIRPDCAALESACREALGGRHAAETFVHAFDDGTSYEVRIVSVMHGLFVYLRDVSEHVRTEQAMRESELNLRLMADSIPQMIWIIESSGQAVYFNRQWVAYTGVPFTPTTPANIVAEFIHPEDRELTMQAWNAAYRDGTAFHVEHRLRSKTGAYRWFLVLAEPYLNAAGKVERWFGTSTGIHEQKMADIALTESEMRYRALALASSDVVYRMSPDWKYMHQLDGRGFLKTTTTLDEYRIEDYVFPDDLDLARTAIDDAIARKTVFELEHRVLRADGGYGWTHSRAVPILGADGAIREWIGTASDISARKLVAEQLAEASVRKDEFLAMLAHELRNPLAPIASAADMLKMIHHGDPRIGKANDIIRRQTRHLAALVDDLLDVSRVTRGLIQLDKQVVELATVVDSAIEQALPLLESKRHRLTVRNGSVPASVTGDRNRLIQVVVNLLNNAAKYTAEGGSISLSLGIQGNRVLVEVEDTGIGIEPTLLPHIFDLFTQAARTPDRTHGGLGIGLALVRTLVTLHDGDITAFSAGLGTGSRFTVSLPLHTAPVMRSHT